MKSARNRCIAGWVMVAWLNGPAHGRTDWFTVTGNRSDPTVDTVEVSPTLVTLQVGERLGDVRVNRAQERKSWEGVAYRSYESEVLFNCTKGSARYTKIAFYQQPGWKGEPYKTVTYTEAENRLMLFKDMAPSPAARIIRAACLRETARKN